MSYGIHFRQAVLENKDNMSIKKALTFFGWPVLFLPTFVAFVGLSMNFIVMAKNNHVMPVENPICQTDEQDKVSADHMHACETSDTKLKWLDDRYPATEQGILSLGDIVQGEADNLIFPSRSLWLCIVGIAFIKRFRSGV